MPTMHMNRKSHSKNFIALFKGIRVTRKIIKNGFPVDTEKNTSILVDNSRTELKLYGRYFLILLVTLEFL
jgi:hypothetical protein